MSKVMGPMDHENQPSLLLKASSDSQPYLAIWKVHGGENVWGLMNQRSRFLQFSAQYQLHRTLWPPMGIAWPYDFLYFPLPFFFMNLSDTQYYVIYLFVLLFTAFLFLLDYKLPKVRDLCSPPFPQHSGLCLLYGKRSLNICLTKE